MSLKIQGPTANVDVTVEPIYYILNTDL